MIVRVDRPSIQFFVSSRRRHTSPKRDWSSDVCSSELSSATTIACRRAVTFSIRVVARVRKLPRPLAYASRMPSRPTIRPPPGRKSEERRVGDEGRDRRKANDENTQDECRNYSVAQEEH